MFYTLELSHGYASKKRFNGSFYKQVRAYSITKNNDFSTSGDCSDLIVISDADKDKLEILKYVKGKSFSDGDINLGLNKLDPNFVTGFTDGEGSFILSITKATD